MAENIGHDFGDTPMGVEQIAARETADCGVCFKRLLAIDMPDVACPVHGLEAFIRDELKAAA